MRENKFTEEIPGRIFRKIGHPEDQRLINGK
jgi:hypothetical protein